MDRNADRLFELVICLNFQDIWWQVIPVLHGPGEETILVYFGAASNLLKGLVMGLSSVSGVLFDILWEVNGGLFVQGFVE